MVMVIVLPFITMVVWETDHQYITMEMSGDRQQVTVVEICIDQQPHHIEAEVQVVVSVRVREAPLEAAEVEDVKMN